MQPTARRVVPQNPAALAAMQAVQAALDRLSLTGFEPGIRKRAAVVVRCLQAEDTDGVKAACAELIKFVERRYARVSPVEPHSPTTRTDHEQQH